MAKVLTMDSSVLCDALTQKTTDDQGNPITPVPLHGGKVTKLSSAKLTVKQKPVLLKNSIIGIVSGCQTPPPLAPTKPCTKATVIKGEATKLTVNGQGVLLEGSLGTTDGNPVGTVPGIANQDKLIAA
jgi:hypothetical protein